MIKKSLFFFSISRNLASKMKRKFGESLAVPMVPADEESTPFAAGVETGKQLICYCLG